MSGKRARKGAQRAAKVAVALSVLAMGACAGGVSRTGARSFLEAIQGLFDLEDRTWLGVSAAVVAHFAISAFLAGVLARFWRPRAAAILLAIVILGKEAVDLTIIALYQSVDWTYASDSVVDVLVSIAGVGLGLWVGTRAAERSITKSKAQGGGKRSS